MYGILGGTFDPVHRGHMALAQAALDFNIQQVFWVPSNIPPHRALPKSTPEHRRCMVELAIKHEPRFVLDDREQRRQGPSYMIDTLASFRESVGPQAPLVLLLGSDAFNRLTTWKSWESLINFAHLMVFTREGHLAIEPILKERWTSDWADCHQTPSGLIYCHSVSLPDISSTQLRERLEPGYLMPDVYEYIQAHQLYA